ncbi:G1/S-specific cyclin-E isoform X2 [Wyeomyia smithii]|uniref:G1/S-specific cyclin-E isoform X2 n=1 Tax=Wyeomyia smithii TaxID=174621 RepID=UPI0024682197|nr:G1/S-specific cyclin-E isoform X2 [Wyeomyia smithii]
MDLRSSEDASRSSTSDVVKLPRTRKGRKRKRSSESASIEHESSAKRNAPADRQSPLAAASAPVMSVPSVVSTAASSNSVASIIPSSGEYISDTQSSSDCYSTTAEIDIFPLVSPSSVNSNILSPTCDGSRSSWNTKGDTTPHGNRKSSSHNNQQHSNNSSNCDNSSSKYSKLYCCVTPSSELRTCPLPPLSWAENRTVWQLMCRKDEKASLEREPNMFDQHPGLQPRMRAILLDWLIEVCEVYKLHRETYYLALNYIDRYLSRKKGQKKTHLQLLGISALFVAAKVEEIYPPKIGEFAYVTDGACSEEDILREELLLLHELQWSINPVTIMGWLGLYMQIHVTNRQSERLPVYSESKSGSCRKQQHSVAKHQTEKKPDDSFVYPQFSGMEFAQTAQLIDLCSLDVGLANFPYSVIAAAAMSHTFDRKTAVSVSGLDWDVIAPCAKWMEPFFLVICDENEVSPLALLESNEQVKGSYGLAHVCPNLVTDSSHIIQTHTTSLDMFDRAALRREQLEALACIIQQEASPGTQLLDPEGLLLTPPASSRKSLETNLNHNPREIENNVVCTKT